MTATIRPYRWLNQYRPEKAVRRADPGKAALVPALGRTPGSAHQRVLRSRADVVQAAGLLIGAGRPGWVHRLVAELSALAVTDAPALDSDRWQEIHAADSIEDAARLEHLLEGTHASRDRLVRTIQTEIQVKHEVLASLFAEREAAS